jgi:hypothetical protein
VVIARVQMPEFLRALPLAASRTAPYIRSRMGGSLPPSRIRDLDLAAGSSFTDAMRSALVGVGAIITGKRDATTHFDVSRPGLLDSFIALLISTGISAALPMLLGTPGAKGTAFELVVSVALLFAAQVGASAMVLNLLGKRDRLIPYVIADNWSSFFVTLGTLALTIMGAPDGILLFPAVILVIAIEINVARVIVGLKPMQVAMFIASHFVAALLGLLILRAIFAPDAGDFSSLPL